MLVEVERDDVAQAMLILCKGGPSRLGYQYIFPDHFAISSYTKNVLTRASIRPKEIPPEKAKEVLTRPFNKQRFNKK